MAESATDATFECMFLVADGLDQYVAMHDRIFKAQATAASILRNLFGRAPDFAELLAAAQSTDELWSTIRQHVADCHQEFQKDFTQDQRDFFSAVMPYIDAVKRTTTLLCRRQEALHAKDAGHPLTLSAYLQIEDDYKRSVDDYVRLGSLLQPKSEKLFETKSPSTP